MQQDFCQGLQKSYLASDYSIELWVGRVHASLIKDTPSSRELHCNWNGYLKPNEASTCIEFSLVTKRALSYYMFCCHLFTHIFILCLLLGGVSKTMYLPTTKLLLANILRIFPSVVVSGNVFTDRKAGEQEELESASALLMDQEQIPLRMLRLIIPWLIKPFSWTYHGLVWKLSL